LKAGDIEGFHDLETCKGVTMGGRGGLDNRQTLVTRGNEKHVHSRRSTVDT